MYTHLNNDIHLETRERRVSSHFHTLMEHATVIMSPNTSSSHCLGAKGAKDHLMHPASTQVTNEQVAFNQNVT